MKNSAFSAGLKECEIPQPCIDMRDPKSSAADLLEFITTAVDRHNALLELFTKENLLKLDGE